MKRFFILALLAGIFVLHGTWTLLSQTAKPARPVKAQQIAPNLHLITGEGGNVILYVTDEGAILVDNMTWAAGIVGSLAAGLLECWADGTQAKFLHSGFAAQNGIHAALLAQAGASGPPRVLEGRFGLFSSHVQDASIARGFDRVTESLGTRWDSRNASFKPFPAAHGR